MRISKTHLLLAFAIMIGASLLATALGQARTKPAANSAVTAAICDVGEIFSHCRQAGDLNAELRNRRTAIKAEDEKRAEALNELSLELQGLKPGSDEYEGRLAKLKKLQTDHKGWREKQEWVLQRWHLKMTKQLYNKITETVALLAKQRGIQIVLDHDHRALGGDDLATVLTQISRRQVLYSDPSVDLTAAVLERLNEEYRTERP